ncbi:YpiF family protein [Siminovitchia sp. FSL H7-0308]|uniref:DUF2487 family protein n=1 Tax=Siminovitchia thermophila TaxID=1245522 RepID=A0ABS2R2L7_9BACI|nr:YpiF family protein [Siminovitchia thermophila]MBM7713625.1 hypothetical protein [Siminovitchia thermophila]ONK21908.1 hypothetical protein BLX87_18545 [Bacillus sp. VT-16-64]
MEWKAKDIEVYLKEKSYIDTVIVPLIPISFGSHMKQIAEKGEFTHLLSQHLERQFKGRALALPPFTYLSEMADNEKVSSIQKWVEHMKEHEVKYVFLLTSDESWRSMAEQLSASLLFAASVPLEHLDEQYKHSIMETQVKQLMNEIVQGWQGIAT